MLEKNPFLTKGSKNPTFLINRKFFNTNNSLYPEEEDDEKYADNQLSMVLLSIIILVGIIGNSLNISVFSKKKMRQGSTFRFLLYLSVADLLVLLVCSTEALARFGFQYEIRSNSQFICKIHTFLTYFLTHISSIILMVISVDRALVVTNKKLIPFCKKKESFANKNKQKTDSIISFERSSSKAYSHRFQFNCLLTRNLHRVDLVICSIIFILTLLNFHYLIFIKLNYKNNRVEDIRRDFKINFNSTSKLAKNVSKKVILIRKQEPELICFPPENTVYNYFLNNVWIWIDICVYSLIPFIIMSICSTIILTRIHNKSKKYFEHLINKNNQFYKTNFYKRLRRNRQLLYMLLMTNLYFLLSQLPYCVLFVLYKGKSSDTSLGQPLVHCLIYTNNAINFLFYGLSSQKYRQELCGIFFKDKKKNNEQKYLSVALQTNPNHFNV